MRTARYHDYVLLKVIMLIALVGLGLFIYLNFVKPVEHVTADNSWVVVKPTCTADGERYKVCDDCGQIYDKHVIPATGHKPGIATKENEKDHSMTEGGSYESVVCCTACNIELSREKVWTCSAQDSVELKVTHENVVNSTCTEKGSYESVKTCTDCKKEMERTVVVVDELGHDYEWELVYENGIFAVVGICDRDGNRTVQTAANNVTFDVKRDETVAPCCLIRYHVTVTIGDYTFIDSMDFEPDRNHTVEYFSDHDSYVNNIPSYTVLPDMLYDAQADKYYYDIRTPGVEVVGAGAYAEWDEYGFCLGKYVCHLCREVGCTADGCPESYVHYVFIYSSEHDSRIEEYIPI